MPIRLLTSNSERFYMGIPWDDLSKLFQEAVKATQTIGVQYIRIDALCIIQDSDDDWHSEAAMMLEVNSTSYLNISADASADGSEGLFRDRNPILARSFSLYHTIGSEYRPQESVCFVNSWTEDIVRRNQRAWFVQERFLAP